MDTAPSGDMSTQSATPAAPTTANADANAAKPAANSEADAPKGRAAILAKYIAERDAAAKADAKPAADAKGGTKPDAKADMTPKAEPPKREPGFAKRRIEALEAELAKAKENSRDAYLESLKKDPARIFTDVGGDDLLLRLAEARGQQLDPAALAKAELEAKIAAVQKQLDDAKESEKRARDENMRGEVERALRSVLDNGVNEDGIEVKAAWPLTKRLTDAGVINGHKEANAIVQKLRGELGRIPTKKETATLIQIAYDQIEAREMARGKHYAPAEAAKPAADTKPKANTTARTITNRVGRGGYVPERKELPASKGARRAEILARLKAGTLATT